MLEDENTRPVCFRELDNAAACQVRDVFINVSDLAPEIGIVRFIFRDEARLRSVVCDASEQSRALCPLSQCHSR